MNTSITSHIYLCLFIYFMLWPFKFYSLSKFQWYNTVWSLVVTLYLQPSHLIHPMYLWITLLLKSIYFMNYMKYLNCYIVFKKFLKISFFSHAPGLWDLISLNGDLTCAPCSGSTVLITGPPGNFLNQFTLKQTSSALWVSIDGLGLFLQGPPVVRQSLQPISSVLPPVAMPSLQPISSSTCLLISVRGGEAGAVGLLTLQSS